uniref:LITAF domain-containing protein n=1 Tax=Plectus sambesii TaxID=2011161 RepID=A0A914UKD2_9BILA
MYPNNPPPPGFHPTSPPVPNTIIVGAFHPMLGEYPAQITCPRCQRQVVTEVNYVNGTMVWIFVLVLLFIFFPLMCVPCCIDQCKDVEHFCPSCRNFIGLKKRI